MKYTIKDGFNFHKLRTTVERDLYIENLNQSNLPEDQAYMNGIMDQLNELLN